MVSGIAQVITDHALRMVAINIADSSVVAQDYVLFEFQIQKVLLVEYADKGKRAIQRWDQEKNKMKFVSERQKL